MANSLVIGIVALLTFVAPIHVSSLVNTDSVSFDDPILTVNSYYDAKKIVETYIRVVIIDPGKDINGIYINLDANNEMLEFKKGEIFTISNLSYSYFGGLGLGLNCFLVQGVAKVVPHAEFLHINFSGKQILLYRTNDLESNHISIEIPNDIQTGVYSFFIVTGEEELHYYSSKVRITQ